MDKVSDMVLNKVVGKQNAGDMCLVCGKDNPFSLKTDFFILDNGVLLGITEGKDVHQSYPDRMHGGLISAILDEVIGRAVQIEHPELWGVTGKLEITFKKPVRLNCTLRAFGKITKMSALSFVGKGYIEDESGTVLATGTATYVKVPIERMTAGDDFIWAQFPDTYPRPVDAQIRHPELLE